MKQTIHNNKWITKMYSFEHKDTEDHPVKDTSIVLENVVHRAKDCLEHLLEEDCWDSQDVDDAV